MQLDAHHNPSLSKPTLRSQLISKRCSRQAQFAERRIAFSRQIIQSQREVLRVVTRTLSVLMATSLVVFERNSSRH